MKREPNTKGNKRHLLPVRQKQKSTTKQLHPNQIPFRQGFQPSSETNRTWRSLGSSIRTQITWKNSLDPWKERCSKSKVRTRVTSKRYWDRSDYRVKVNWSLQRKYSRASESFPITRKPREQTLTRGILQSHRYLRGDSRRSKHFR
jgi:hypothetical protein